MYEELLQPLQISLELNSYLNIDRKLIENKYGKDILNKIIMLQDDFYKTDAAKTGKDFNTIKLKAKEDFLKLYPNICSEVLDILLSDYLFNNR